MRSSYAALRALVVVAHIAAPLAATSASYAAAPAAHGLPAPQVSRALDAVLLPIDKAVVKTFKLAKGTHGLLVLAVQPGGVADKQGVKPGDVLTEIRGHKVRKPIDVDIAAKRSLKAGPASLPLALVRAGAPVVVVAVVTLAEYNETISMTQVSTWESYSSESFSYSEYMSEESQSIESSYESEETSVEEATLSEESVTEDASSDEQGDEAADTTDDAGADDAGDDGSDDAGDDGADDGGADGADDGDDGDSGDEGGGDDGGSDDSDG